MSIIRTYDGKVWGVFRAKSGHPVVEGDLLRTTRAPEPTPGIALTAREANTREAYVFDSISRPPSVHFIPLETPLSVPEMIRARVGEILVTEKKENGCYKHMSPVDLGVFIAEVEPATVREEGEEGEEGG